MRLVFIFVLSCFAAVTFAKPATQPWRGATSSTKPSTAPVVTTGNLPTPAELIEKMKAMKAKKQAAPKIAYFDLSRRITEKPADFAFFGEQDVQTLNSVLDRMRQAREDKSVRAVLITMGDESPSLAQAQEIRDALLKLNKAGKQTFVYADSYDTAGYTLASGASRVCMLEGGDIMIPGVGFSTMFAKELLDKVGVKADSIQIGEYKGADEEYTRSSPSE